MFADKTNPFKHVWNNIQQTATTVNRYLDIMHTWSMRWLVLNYQVKQNCGYVIFK